MTTTRYFKSTDASAPVLTGQSGSLIALLHACLVGTAGVAYGSGPTAKTAAGWTEPFTNTSTKGAWQNSVAAGGTGYCIRVLDDGSLASTFKEAGMRAYRTMSDIDTGVNPTPTVAQLASGVIVRKSTTADSTVRAWELVADELGFWLYINANPASSPSAESGVYTGGDIVSEVSAGDPNGFLIGGRVTINTAGGSQPGWITASNTAGAGSGGFYIGTGYAQTGAAILPAMVAFGPSVASGQTGSFMADPALGSGQRYFLPAYLSGESMIRGRVRGLYNCLNALASTVTVPTDVTSGVGLPTGSILRGFPILYTGGQNCVPFVERVLPW